MSASVVAVDTPPEPDAIVTTEEGRDFAEGLEIRKFRLRLQP
jgi:hypothetical protein